MRILAIDTALTACTACVRDMASDELLAGESLEMARGHAEALMPLIGRVMGAAALDFGELDRIAVTVGPGSFTGLRVGISAARGIALATGKPAIGVSTLAAFAAPCIADYLADQILVAIDARNGNAYVQGFGGGGRTVIPGAHMRLADAAGLLDGEVHLAGSSAAELAALWPTQGPRPLHLRKELTPDIEWVARLGAAASPEHAPAKPLYLRQPDAKPAAPRLPASFVPV